MYKYVAKYLMLEKVYKFCEVTSFPSLLIGLVLFALGAFQALFIASADVQQDEVYRIIYIHVPSAILSELIYIFLAICGLIFLVWKTFGICFVCHLFVIVVVFGLFWLLKSNSPR